VQRGIVSEFVIERTATFMLYAIRCFASFFHVFMVVAVQQYVCQLTRFHHPSPYLSPRPVRCVHVVTIRIDLLHVNFKVDLCENTTLFLFSAICCIQYQQCEQHALKQSPPNKRVFPLVD
jgi:hypothetical protein